MADFRHPDWTYVSRLRNDLQWELQGWHTKIKELEALRYYEDLVPATPGTNQTGNENIKIGLTDMLIETVKSAVLAGSPIVHIKPHREVQDAQENASLRERAWQYKVDHLMGGNNTPNYIAEVVDAQLLGLGVLKTAQTKSKWDPLARQRKQKEKPKDHISRVKALKKKWGDPTSNVTVHPLAFFFRPGLGARVEEVIEHSYKPKRSVYDQYDLYDRSVGGGDGTQINKTTAQITKTMTGQPNQFIRPLPQGFNSTNFVLVTEYWNPDCYQVYVNGQMVYEELGPPTVAYFIAPGRSSSSKDPDKYTISVAENLRHNEPEINRVLARMVEATDLIVNKRNTIEVPESYTPEVDIDEKEGTNKPRVWQFNAEYAEALPPGAKIVDPFEGASEVMLFMPMVQLMMQIANVHSANPIMSGVSPGAAGSGYRDNTLYLIAKTKYEYIVQAVEDLLAAYLEWHEWLVCTHIKEEVYYGENALSPKDIEDYPATITVELKPQLPQNLIAEGEFWSRQQAEGNVSRRYHREHGLGLEQPDEMGKEVWTERAQELMMPMIIQDAIRAVLAPQPGSGLVGPDGQPISSGQGTDGAPNALAMMMGGGGANGGGRDMGRSIGGFATQGQPHAPANQPGATPGMASKSS